MTRASLMLRRTTLRAATLAVLASTTLVANATACFRDGTGPAAVTETAAFPFYAVFNAGALVATVVVTVSGPGITTPLIFNIPVVAGVASGSLSLPVGSGRVVTAEAFDVTGALLYTGTATVTVTSGTNAAINLVLAPLVGSVPINATIGAIIVAVTPTTATVRAGNTVQLTATARDFQNNPVAATFLYASGRPPAGWSSPTGLVTALDTGSVTFTVTALGSAATAVLTVTPGTRLTSGTILPATVSAATGGTVNATFGLTDASTAGVDSIRVTYTGPGANLTCLATTPFGGTRNVGDFRCGVPISASTATGTWSLASLAVFWGGPAANGGGSTLLTSDLLRARGVTQTLTVTP